MDEEVTAIGGRYCFTEEARLPFGDREVLYFKGWAVFDTTCCGSGSSSYVFVPGFLVDLKTRRNEQGLQVSLVEPIRDGSVQEAIRGLISGKEIVRQISFL
jgi:hypothetical protein